MRRDWLTAPNQLTLLRLFFIPVTAIAIVDHRYKLALTLFVLAGISDALDGLLARWLKQKTVLGQYLDPIADKLLLSTLFLILSASHDVPWRVTILVFSRDILILIVAAVLYGTNTLRDFAPSIYGKANTFVQIFALFFVLVARVQPHPYLLTIERTLLLLVMLLTILSGVHYVVLVGRRMRQQPIAKL